jgi:hypothetical protein
VTVNKHTTIIETDVSQALAAEAKLTVAVNAQAAATRELADVMRQAQAEQIKAAQQSEDIARRRAAYIREAQAELRHSIDLSRREQAELRQTIALHKAEERAIREVAREREAGFARAEAAAAKYQAQLAKQQSMGGAMGGGGLMMRAAGPLAAVGATAAIGKAAFDITDQFVDESYKVESVSKNLQLDIRAARAELGGLVDDFTIAQAANKAYAMDVADTGAEFAHIADMVAQQATKIGRDKGELINEAIEAFGKQEAEIFDNLGVGALRLTDAYEIYAESVGKSANELTKAEKAEAFKTAGILLLEKATGKATVGVDGFTRSWKEFGVEFDNVKNRVLGFDDETGRVNEALRELTDEQLDRLKFAEALNDEDAKRMDAMGRTAREMQGYVEQWGIGIMDLKEHADAQGVSYLEMLEQAKQAHAAQAEELERQRIEAEKMSEVADLTAQADETDHIVQLLQIEGASQRDILSMQIASLETQREAATIQAELTKSTEDQAKVVQLTRAIELAEAKAAASKRGSGKGDPNKALDRETDAMLRQIDARRQILQATGDTAVEQGKLIDLAREELDIRQRAADLRVVRGKDAQAKQEAELLDIATERELLLIEQRHGAREFEREAAEERLAAIDREIEKLEAQGVATQLLQLRRSLAHEDFLKEFGTREELVQAEHERAVIYLEERIAAEQKARDDALARFDQEHEINQVRGDEYNTLATQRIDLELSMLDTEQHADQVRTLLHKREMARINEQVKRRQIATAATNNLLGQGMSLFSFVAERAIKDEAKREKATLKARGVEAVARGALETVESVAAFASFNYVQGALHAVAAGVAYATGIAMIAGKVPDKGAGAAGGGGAGEGYTTSLGPDSGAGSSKGSSGSADTPVSAEALMRLRGGNTATATSQTSGKGGGTVINISHSSIVSGNAGSLIADIDKQASNQWGSRT